MPAAGSQDDTHLSKLAAIPESLWMRYQALEDVAEKGNEFHLTLPGKISPLKILEEDPCPPLQPFYSICFSVLHLSSL